MPDYEVTLDGKRFVLTGDHPPTEAEARAVIGGIKPVPSHEPTQPKGDMPGSSLLPAAGGIAGSMAGGPVGAAIGGAAGEGYRQLVNHATEIPGAIRDVARNLVSEPSATLQGFGQGAVEGAENAGLQGAGQAAADVGGRVAGRLLTKGASRLYQSALKPSVTMRAQYPTLVETGLKNAIPVSSGGAEQAAELAGRSMNKADALVAARQNGVLQRLPNGAAIDPREIYANAMSKGAAKGNDLAVGRAGFQKAVGDAGEQFLAENPNPIDLTTAQAQVRTGDRFLNKAYRAALDRGDTIASGDLSGKLAVNDATRAALRNRVPGLADQNAETQALQGVRKAVERRVGNIGNLSPVGMQRALNAGIAGGTGVLGGKDRGLQTLVALEALTDPAIASRMAIGMDVAGGVSAQAVRQALLGLMTSHALQQGDQGP